MKKTVSKKNVLFIQASVLCTINLLRQHITRRETSKEYIHQLRVEIKHLRAWLKLLKNKADNPDLKKMDQRLSEHAKQLGSIRDEQVISDTLDFLCDKSKTKEEQAAVAYFKTQLICKPINTSIISEELNKEILESLDIFEQNFIIVKSTSKLHKRLKHTFKKCEHFAKNVFPYKGNNKELHKLRKCVKNLYYQLSYTNELFLTNKKLKSNLHKLGNNLGKVHDLIIIKDRIASSKETILIKAAHSLIDKNIALIIKAAKHDYKKLFYSSDIKTIL